jgi:hypothetical protein
MATFLSVVSSSEMTLVAVAVLSAVLIIGVLAALKGGGNFFGKFRVGGVSGEVKSSTPPAVDLKNASAGRNIQISEHTGKRVTGDSVTAGNDLVITTRLPNDRSPKGRPR